MEKKVQYGEIYYYDFGERSGSCQRGLHPALVIQEDRLNFNSPTTIVSAITSVTKKPSLLSHVVLGQNFGLTKPSMVLFEQIAVVNQNELLDYIGKVDSKYILRRIKEATKKTFGLWDFTVRQKRRASLCTEHLKEAMKDKGVIISRTHPFESKKQKCRKCNSLGYEYLITNKKEG